MVPVRQPNLPRRQTLNAPPPMNTLKLQLLPEEMGFPGSTVVITLLQMQEIQETWA